MKTLINDNFFFQEFNKYLAKFEIDGIEKCSASFVGPSKNVLLTAGHCVDALLKHASKTLPKADNNTKEPECESFNTKSCRWCQQLKDAHSKKKSPRLPTCEIKKIGQHSYLVVQVIFNSLIILFKP